MAFLQPLMESCLIGASNRPTEKIPCVQGRPCEHSVALDHTMAAPTVPGWQKLLAVRRAEQPSKTSKCERTENF